jgi:hypothetical protein
MSSIHIAALFATSAAAHGARDDLAAAGIDASRILVLDRGHTDPAATERSPRRLWAALKAFFMPDEDANHYAEAIVRGHPLLVVDVTEAEEPLAMRTLEAAKPINVEAHDEGWVSNGWQETAAAERALATVRGARDAAGSEGITNGGLFAGDYGSVGAVHGATVDTDIMRGKQLPNARVRVYRPR